MNSTTQLEQYQQQASKSQTSQPPREAPEDLLDCPYGRRYIRRVTDDGDVAYDEVPLALDDLLHPEEEDELVAVLGHSQDCGRLSTGLDRLTPPNKTFVVLEDVNVDLGLPGVKPIRPDVGVFEVAAIPDGLSDMGTFHMKRHAAVPVLFIEVTSGSTRPNDLGPKFRMYEQAKVQQFIVVDRVHPSGTGRLAGFEYRGQGLVELQPDLHGRFWLAAFDLWIGLEDGVAVLYDANGLVPDSEGLAKQLEDERLSSQQHQQQAEDERIRADSAQERLRELEAELARLRSQEP
ncbi:MAG: Uma2 family endonuclease [Planctomycetota bacterium]|nr:Uma2 family endonuclease [Planctomycetota bacterium]